MKVIHNFRQGPVENALRNVLPSMSAPKKMPLMAVLLFYVFCSPSFAQPSVLSDKTFGGTGNDVSIAGSIATPDGGYLLAGNSNSNISGDKSENSRGTSDDYWIVKIDAQYNKVWDKTFGGETVEELRSIIPAPDGGYLLAGYSLSGLSGDKSQNSRGGYDYWVVKIDSQGSKIWDKTFGGSGMDILQTALSTADGGYLLGGYSDSNASGDKSGNAKGALDYWVVKIDSQGSKVWDKTLGGNADDHPHDIIAVDGGGWLLSGTSDSNRSGDKSRNSKGSADYWIVKIDNQGNKVWDKTIGGSGIDAALHIVRSPDGSYLVAGYSSSNASGDKSQNSRGGFDYWVVKINAIGNKIWDKTYGSNYTDGLSSMISVPDGGYLLGGSSFSNALGEKSENTRGNWDYWVIKIDAGGNKVWDKTIGGSGDDELGSIIPLANGNYQLAGFSRSIISGEKSAINKGSCDAYGSCTADYWIVDLSGGPASSLITSLTLMNAITEKEIKELKNGDIIRLSEVGNNLLDIRANIKTGNISKVVFNLKGPVPHQQTETIAPYALFGDIQGAYNGRKLLPGKYTLTVTPYINNVQAAALTISFTVTESVAISSNTVGRQITVFPIPASSVINIIHGNEAGQAEMTLTDFKGNVVLHRPLRAQPLEQLDVSTFRKGTYYLKIASPEGAQITRVIVE